MPLPETAVTAPAPTRRTGVRADLLAGGAAVLLVAAASAVGQYLNQHTGVRIFAGAPPLFGVWQPHLGPGTPLAVLVAVLVVTRGPDLASALPWPRLLLAGYATAVAWTLALATVDGWRVGVAGRLATTDEYLHEVGGITDIGALLRGFAGRVLDFQPDSWTTHVAGHPPGATLVFVWLDRIGLSGGGWAALCCVLVGSLAAVAVPVALRELGAARAARAAVPFAVLFPGAVWLGVSADAVFTGVTSVGVALLAVSAARRLVLPGLAAGVLLGFGLFLSYGLVLMAVPALAVCLLARDWRALVLAGLGAAAVVAVFAAAGFWWLDGYHLVVARYYQGIASARPYGYWVWANLACLVLAVGPAAAAGVRRALRPTTARALPALAVLTLAGLGAVLLADVSGLSKAEVERIWLPFAGWLVAACALLPAPARRWWLAAQAVTALAVNHLVLTNW
ncbi:hypothetical protein LX83_004098 [Goodfellowiella coeruleoviolacea]|uniref:Integral membrane protein n=1 Tax=Goodfellowiella coeruleoviolacea TaxID=334858 RepID=A0AAE3KHE6_9PSEU|nr:hypothetical protein [Goodfellowiella coeruleoviolacea]